MAADIMRTGPIRYARAGRFEAPEAVGPGEGEPSSGAICPQLPSRLEAVMGRPAGSTPQSEDCLNLTVATPGTDDAGRPVMVFLHGGAFNSGGGLLGWYQGAKLAAEGDVVVVSVNYRLGAFGYLVADGVSDGNLGLADQVEALRWVSRNIARYGGDPGNVTVFGQSAGGLSIMCLLAVPAAQGLFGRAILQSAPPLMAAAPLEQARANGAFFVEALGEDPRTASPASMLAAHRATAQEHASRSGGAISPPFSPTLGTGPPAGWDGRPGPLAAGIDLLAGWNDDDFSVFAADHDPEGSLTAELMSGPWCDLAGRFEAAGARVRGYALGWRPEGSPFRAAHCVELPLLLGDEDDWRGSPMLGRTPWAEVEAFGRALRAVWAGFARTGQLDTERAAGHPVRWASSAAGFADLARS